MAFTDADLLEGLAAIFGEHGQATYAEQRLYDYVQILKARDKERKQDESYKAQRRAYMREYGKLAHVRDRQKQYSREYQRVPEHAATHKARYGEKKRLHEQKRRKDPIVGAKIREMDRLRYQRKKKSTTSGTPNTKRAKDTSTR